MNNELIISQTIQTRLKNISARIDGLRRPHFAAQEKPVMWIRNVLIDGAAANTYYYVSPNPSARPFVIPTVLNGHVLYSLGTIAISSTSAYAASVTAQIRYHQLLPSIYDAAEVAAETDYIVLNEREIFFSKAAGYPNLVDDFNIMTSFEKDFPEIVGTYGYVTLWVKTSTAVAPGINNGLSMFSELVIN